MASMTMGKADRAAVGDWLMGLGIGLVVCLCGWAVWLYTSQASGTDTKRPVPIWLSLGKVVSQLEDGQRLAFKVDLQLKAKDDLDAVQPHTQALEHMLQELGQDLSRDDVAGPQGMQAFGKDIRRSVNNYLRHQQVPTKVTSVAFEELLLMP